MSHFINLELREQEIQLSQEREGLFPVEDLESENRELVRLLDERNDRIKELELKLETYEAKFLANIRSTSGVDIFQAGYTDGKDCLQPSMPYYGEYRRGWEQGFRESLENGVWWEVLDKFVPF